MRRGVVIFNAVEHVQLAIARSLHRKGIRVTVADINGSAQRPRSRAVHRFVKLPSVDNSPNKFADELTALILSENDDMVFPCSDPGLVAVSTCYEQLRSLVYLACPPPEVVARVLNKGLTLKAARQCNIAIPATHTICDQLALEGIRSRLRFPVIAKPASKTDERCHRFKMRYFARFEDLAREFRNEPRFGTSYLFQEYCAGVGVGIEILMHGGQPLVIFQHRRVRELPITGGGSVAAVSEKADPLLAGQAVTLLRELGWEGAAMVEFRYDPTERKGVLMEVNGRYWGSLPLAIRAGIDFPFYEWQLAHGETPAIPKSYRCGLRTRWLSGDIRRLQSLLTETETDGLPRPSIARELIRIAGDFAPNTHPAVWLWSDPLPAVDQLRVALRQLVKALLSHFTRFDEYRHLGWLNTKWLLRERVLHTLRFKRYLPPRDLSRVKSVLFVCHGNLIRSPMAAALLRRHLARSKLEPGIEVFSAGLIEHPQEQSDERAKEAAADLGISLAHHHPERLTAGLIEEADIIFVMDRFNEARMLAAHPAAKSKMFLLASLNVNGHRGPLEIRDPSLGDVAKVRRCYSELEIHVQKLADMLVRTRMDGSVQKEAFRGALQRLT
jgi:protein-tyrosine-phosphatase/predicted ATP-grasp superfamily ATP-dependent carboligase